MVFVMEGRHRDILRQEFSSALAGKQLMVLDIADDYQFNDPELVGIFDEALRDYLR